MGQREAGGGSPLGPKAARLSGLLLFSRMPWFQLVDGQGENLRCFGWQAGGAAAQVVLGGGEGQQQRHRH